MTLAYNTQKKFNTSHDELGYTPPSVLATLSNSDDNQQITIEIGEVTNQEYSFSPKKLYSWSSTEEGPDYSTLNTPIIKGSFFIINDIKEQYLPTTRTVWQINLTLEESTSEEEVDPDL